MRRYVYQFILLTVLCCMPALSSAQQTKVVIRGVVTAAIDKLPLPRERMYCWLTRMDVW